MRWAIFTVVLIGGVTFVGYGFMKARAEQAEASVRSDQQAAGIITSDDIVDAFTANEVAGQAKYGRNVTVTGTVKNVHINAGPKHAGRVWVIFKTNGEANGGALGAALTSPAGAAELHPGDTATVTCATAGNTNTGEIAMLDCTLR